MHWIPLSFLLPSVPHTHRRWTTVAVDVYSRLVSRNWAILRPLCMLTGQMQYNAIQLGLRHRSSFLTSTDRSHFDVEKEFENDIKVTLWGVTLGLILDIVSFLEPELFMIDYPRDELSGLGLSMSPSMP